jgi:hypothetical protein
MSKKNLAHQPKDFPPPGVSSPKRRLTLVQWRHSSNTLGWQTQSDKKN